jgi:hypothetical protein
MTRWIDVYVMRDNAPRSITGYVAAACGFSYADNRHQGLKVGGCGMDMGFHVVYSLGRAMYPYGVPCTGEGCLSNAHSYADWDYTVSPEHVHSDGGYAFQQRWL